VTVGRNPVAVVALKSVHTVIFAGEVSAILWLVISGLVGRRDRTVGIAAAAVATEAAVFLANDGVCPITPLTERLGAAHGSVSDIFLPEVLARTIPIWSTVLLVVAGLLHIRAFSSRIWMRDRPIVADPSSDPDGDLEGTRCLRRRSGT
jgi:hypothetical protein